MPASSRTLVIGDIHGCSTALNILIDTLNIQMGDTLVTLGDYVDRGPDARGVINRLRDLSHSTHLVALRGNHELMMLNARQDLQDTAAMRDWMQSGGEATLRSYGSLAEVPEAHWRFIEDYCLDCWENDTHLFVHAGAYPDMPLYEQPDYMLFWDRFDDPPPHESGKTLVCGHTSQKNGLPRYNGHAVCLDTWACGKGWLSCLHTETGRILQANQAGQQQELWLNELLD